MGVSILVAGNPVDGFRFIGPFGDQEEAIIYGDSVDDCWHAVELEEPDGEAPDELHLLAPEELWELFGKEDASDAELELLVKDGNTLQKAFAYLLMEKRAREAQNMGGVSDLFHALSLLYTIRRGDRFPVNGG